ncbi:hypothetical protein [Halorarum salinum]|uniref:Lycopene cyclase domain-containing protein n=1 Tax=Halorarum salinum TaxID=2743089 RepID=A0A7D5LDU4_9EURY|nr:hypothetical protein [Halobaculum salinum]QLG64228.1 hypothetical protein HUG12_20810 [Halobaculum salinum]
MTVLLDVARAAAGVNVLLLLVMGWVWLGNYRRHGASHTLGFLVVGAFLLVENVLWLYFYLAHPAFVGWFVDAGTDVQAGMTMLCGLELVALVVLARITLR